MTNLPRLHLTNKVTHWIGDGDLVMQWRVITEQGKPMCKWTTYAWAEAYREKLYSMAIKKAERDNNPEWDLCL